MKQNEQKKKCRKIALNLKIYIKKKRNKKKEEEFSVLSIRSTCACMVKSSGLTLHIPYSAECSQHLYEQYYHESKAFGLLSVSLYVFEQNENKEEIFRAERLWHAFVVYANDWSCAECVYILYNSVLIDWFCVWLIKIKLNRNSLVRLAEVSLETVSLDLLRMWLATCDTTCTSIFVLNYSIGTWKLP